MHKKYFFFDIDQTLGVGITKVVPPDTQYCLDELQRCGHFVALATGRLQYDAAQFASLMVLAVSLPMAGTALL